MAVTLERGNESKFPHALTNEQKINFEHDAYAASRQRVYIKRQADFDRLTKHAESDAAPLIISFYTQLVVLDSS